MENVGSTTKKIRRKKKKKKKEINKETKKEGSMVRDQKHQVTSIDVG